jgi:hypothetical protein
MALRNYNKLFWTYQDQDIPVQEMTEIHCLDFFITTFKMVKTNPDLNWLYGTKLYSHVLDRAKEFVSMSVGMLG